MELRLIEGGKQEPSHVKKGGAVIVVNGAWIVLVRPHEGTTEDWVLPKGHVEGNESSLQCAIREALEETGTVTEALGEIPCATTQRFVEDKNEQETVEWWLLKAAALTTEKITDKDETGAIRKIGLFPAMAALAKLSYFEHRSVLVQAIGG